MPEKKGFGKAVRISQYILALSIILLILYFSGIQNVLEIFSQINPVFIIPAIAAYLLNNILMSFRIKKILTDIDKKIRLKFVFFSPSCQRYLPTASNVYCRYVSSLFKIYVSLNFGFFFDIKG